jgi:hypothetical protein
MNKIPPDSDLGHLGIQAAHLIRAFNLGYDEGVIVYRVTRWRRAGSLRDLQVARHHLDALIAEAEGTPSLSPSKKEYERAEKLHALPPDPEEARTFNGDAGGDGILTSLSSPLVAFATENSGGGCGGGVRPAGSQEQADAG